MPETNILILDDESAIKENLQIFMEDEGYKVTSCDNAETAIELIYGGECFNIGIVDVRLPGMNGIEFIKKAREIAPLMRFIVHTGSLNFRFNDELDELGLKKEDIFKKPIVDIQALISRMKQVL